MDGRDTLGAWDFYDDAGQPRDRIAEIEAVTQVQLAGTSKIKASKKPLLTLRGSSGTWPKKLVVNVTIGNTIARMYGPNIKDWVGKRIQLYPDQTRGQQGEMVDCVRVRPKVPKGAATAAPDRPVDEEMRAKQKEQAGETLPAEAPREPGSDDE